jgi:hypothetical protein
VQALFSLLMRGANFGAPHRRFIESSATTGGPEHKIIYPDTTEPEALP